VVGRYATRTVDERDGDDDESDDDHTRPSSKQPGRARAKPRRPGFAS
jgi:hypothetical protein